MAFYLTGCVTDVRHLLDAKIIGYMNTPNNGHTMNGWVWAADNSCYGKNYVGDDKWFNWLQSFSDVTREKCLFATAPDVVGDYKETLIRSTPWLSRIQNLGFPAAFVAQDGLTNETCPWNAFDVLFIGGSTDWKLSESAFKLIRKARQLNKKVHVGRVNSRQRLRMMASAQVDSVDGTYLAFGPKINAPKLQSWIDELQKENVFDFSSQQN